MGDRLRKADTLAPCLANRRRRLRCAASIMLTRAGALAARSVAFDFESPASSGPAMTKSKPVLREGSASYW
jgi:hypothetical protein